MTSYQPPADNAPLNKQEVVQVTEHDRDFITAMKTAYGARSRADIVRMAMRIAFPEIARHAPAQRPE